MSNNTWNQKYRGLFPGIYVNYHTPQFNSARLDPTYNPQRLTIPSLNDVHVVKTWASRAIFPLTSFANLCDNGKCL